MDNFNMVSNSPVCELIVQNAACDANKDQGFDHMDMGNPLQTGDMLNDFDFDSFLNDNDTENQPFDFNGAFSVEGEIGTE